ncbi:hypothetical protein ANO14919_073260 [Xylariales sp. No.14919]|nr:hypothetical protein F5X98DRAFT_389706 [Xylaria grammica]GAW17859.1 hypothetical protein ANO14919_073260 [Xylariales sp. No.14919]
MEPTIGGSQGAILYTNKIPGQTEIQPAISCTGSLGAFLPTASGTPRPPFNSSFNNSMFGLDLLMLPPNGLDSLVDSFPLGNISMGDPFPSDLYPISSLPLDDTLLCSRCHKTHPPWPKKGVLEIQKCERKCHYCGQELKTAAALRKHAKNHKEKDKFDIEIARGSSGRQRRALLPDEHPSALIPSFAAHFDTESKDVDGAEAHVRYLQPRVTELEKRNQIAETEKESITQKHKHRGDNSERSQTSDCEIKEPFIEGIFSTSEPARSHRFPRPMLRAGHGCVLGRQLPGDENLSFLKWTLELFVEGVADV